MSADLHTRRRHDDFSQTIQVVEPMRPKLLAISGGADTSKPATVRPLSVAERLRRWVDSLWGEA